MILLVEDDPPSSRALTLALKTAGYEVINADNGTEALELLVMHDFELVITDLVMPNLNGLNLINAVHFKRPHMPVILMSGYLVKDAGKAIIDQTAVFLQKPINPTALIMAVDGCSPNLSSSYFPQALSEPHAQRLGSAVHLFEIQFPIWTGRIP
jgi:DNA-binding NtrC family response regulator